MGKTKIVGFLFYRIDSEIRTEWLQTWFAALGMAAFVTGMVDSPNLLFGPIHSLAYFMVLPDYWGLVHDFHISFYFLSRWGIHFILITQT